LTTPFVADLAKNAVQRVVFMKTVNTVSIEIDWNIAYGILPEWRAVAFLSQLAQPSRALRGYLPQSCFRPESPPTV
jgi:hypothetical protein